MRLWAFKKTKVDENDQKSWKLKEGPKKKAPTVTRERSKSVPASPSRLFEWLLEEIGDFWCVFVVFCEQLGRSADWRGAPKNSLENRPNWWKSSPKSFQKAASKPRPNAVAKSRSKSAQNGRKSWPKAGQELAKNRPGTGQKPARNWPEMGQKVIKKWSQTGSLQNGGIWVAFKTSIWPWKTIIFRGNKGGVHEIRGFLVSSRIPPKIDQKLAKNWPKAGQKPAKSCPKTGPKPAHRAAQKLARTRPTREKKRSKVAPKLG